MEFKVTVKVGGQRRSHELSMETGRSVGRESGESTLTLKILDV